MRAITHRIRKLEARLTPNCTIRPGFHAAIAIYERRRRRFEREGRPFTDLPPDPTPPIGPVRYLSAAETIQRRRDLRLKQLAHAAGGAQE